MNNHSKNTFLNYFKETESLLSPYAINSENSLSLDPKSLNKESMASEFSEKWDSLGTLTLLSSFEEFYNVKLDILEIQYLASVSTIIELLKLKGINIIT